jgi:hypothetical protein
MPSFIFGLRVSQSKLHVIRLMADGRCMNIKEKLKVAPTDASSSSDIRHHDCGHELIHGHLLVRVDIKNIEKTLMFFLIFSRLKIVFGF